MTKHLQDNMYYNIKIKLYYAYGFQQRLFANHHLFLSNKSQIEHTECVDRHTQYYMPTVFNKALLRIPPPFCAQKSQIEHTVGFDCNAQNSTYYRCIH